MSLSKEDFTYSKHDPNDLFEFTVMDKRNDAKLRLRSQELFFTEGENQDDDVIFG